MDDLFVNVCQVNTLNQEVMKEFTDVMKQVQADPAVKAVVLISSKSDCFIAGADIRFVISCFNIVCHQICAVCVQRVALLVDSIIINLN